MESEGVIKFQLDFVQGPPVGNHQIASLDGWRRFFYLCRLIGRDRNRYGGFGYGNISARMEPWDAPPHQRAFVISGSQTGHIPDTDHRHYAVVTAYHPERGQVKAHGPVRPSSESLTHGIIYDLIPSARCVIHGHSPEIWQHTGALHLAVTERSATYGSLEMTREIRRLLQDPVIRIFAMGGHQDGVVAFGSHIEEAGCLLSATLARALSL